MQLDFVPRVSSTAGLYRPRLTCSLLLLLNSAVYTKQPNSALLQFSGVKEQSAVLEEPAATPDGLRPNVDMHQTCPPTHVGFVMLLSGAEQSAWSEEADCCEWWVGVTLLCQYGPATKRASVTWSSPLGWEDGIIGIYRRMNAGQCGGN